MGLKDAKINNQKIYKDKNPKDINMLPGDRNGSPDDSFFDDAFMFIGAGFLSKLSKYLGDGKYLVYDLINFCENLCKKQKLNCKKIFYYTAPPFQSNAPNEEERKRKDKHDRFIRRLSKNKKIEIKEGRCQKIIKNGFIGYSQKAVDSLIVIDLMKVPLKFSDIKKICLIACDSDFVPVIKELEELGIEVILFTYFTRKRNTNFSRSSHLNNIVSRYIRLSREDFDEAPLEK